MTNADAEFLWDGRATQMSAAGKIEYVLESILKMLQNDLMVVVESGCEMHGCGSGPNFTVSLLCMIACETVGALSAPTGVRKQQATRAFLGRVAHLADDDRYERLSRLLVALFRNGIAHSFLPKQGQHLAAETIWMRGCVDELKMPGNLQVDFYRTAAHLVVVDKAGRLTLQVVSKILYLDVNLAIDEFADRLRSLKPGTAAEADFVAAFDDWASANEKVEGRDYLTELERKLLDGTYHPVFRSRVSDR